MNSVIRLWSLFALLMIAGTASGDELLIKDGQPRAEIIIAADAPRMTVMAAGELQDYLARISGAVLPIRHQRGGDLPLAIFVGASDGTQQLGIDIEKLPQGSLLLRSGRDWLVLAGHDEDFTPPEPWGRGGAQPAQQESDSRWDAVSGGTWRNPLGALWRRYNDSFSAEPQVQHGPSQAAAFPADFDSLSAEQQGSWAFDKHGSLTAVHEFLERLGVRWYWPGELGEVVPQLDSIALPAVDETIEPAYPLRNFMFSQYFWGTRDDLLYSWRLRLNHGDEVLGVTQPHQGHGGRLVHAREEMKAAHPEYYALRAGARLTDFKGAGMPCLSNEGLRQETIAFVRAAFDTFDLPAISICPQDGFRMCECEDCQGLDDPERGRAGMYSNYVWDFVQHVAEAVYETHPDRDIVAMAYGMYHLPPNHIEKLSPNILLSFMAPRLTLSDPAAFEEQRAVLAEWEKIGTPGRMFRYPHYLNTMPGRGWEGIPAVFPRAIAIDLSTLPGRSLGDFIEVSRTREALWHSPAINHLNWYVTSKLYWDPHLDLEALLDEYYSLFYGPAADPMRAAIEHAEHHWMAMRDHMNRQPAEMFIQLLDEARAAAGDDIYGQRIDVWREETQPLREMLARTTTMREGVRHAWLHPTTRHEGLAQYDLRNNETGRRPEIGTTFQVGWDRDAILFDIRCEEPDMAGLRIIGDQDNDPRIWDGDTVEILLETQNHSYYQIAINPAGIVTDLDRSNTQRQFGWTSHAEVSTEHGEDYWRVIVRIPVVPEDSVDHLNNVIGRVPTGLHPWYFQVGRNRERGTERQLSAFSATGDPHNFHAIEKFGRLSTRR